MSKDDPRQLTTVDHASIQAPSVEVRSPRLVLLINEPAGARTVEIADGQALVVGRAETADLQVSDPSVSRQHARLSRAGLKVRVEDLGSHNGIMMDGQRSEQAVMEVGQHIALGSVTLTLQTLAAPSQTVAGVDPYPTFVVRLGAELRRARAFKRPLSLVWIRPLHRRDTSLKDFAPGVRQAARAVDVFGGYGSHELVVAMPETTLEQAREQADGWIRKGPAAGRLLCGVASYPEHSSASQSLLASAQSSAQVANGNTPVNSAPAVAQVRDARAPEPLRKSPAMQQVYRTVERIANARVSVLVLGETGVGKELVARALHTSSARKQAPLRVVNCAAIPENLIESVLFGHEKGAFTGADQTRAGVFEDADRGTVFLDEVGELSAPAQAALLRVLESGCVMRVGSTEERQVDVRVVAATHRDLQTMIDAGEFRLDLYHRLNAMCIEVPPLRERPEEVEPLAERFLEAACAQWNTPKPALDESALQVLHAHNWPGNVRELRNVMERALALCDGEHITTADLPTHFSATESGATKVQAQGLPDEGLDLPAYLKEQELSLVREALERCDGSPREAAKLLRMPLRTFERRVQELKQRA